MYNFVLVFVFAKDVTRVGWVVAADNVYSTSSTPSRFGSRYNQYIDSVDFVDFEDIPKECGSDNVRKLEIVEISFQNILFDEKRREAQSFG